MALRPRPYRELGDVAMQQSIPVDPELGRSIEEVKEVARFLWERGWAERNAGNISLDVTDRVPAAVEGLGRYPVTEIDQRYPGLSGCAFLVSGAGTRMRDLAREPAENACILRIGEGSSSYHRLWGGEGEACFRPTSELASHLRIHQSLRERQAPERAVVHTHPNELIALTQAAEYGTEAAINRVLWAMLPEVKIFLPEGVGLVPYQRPGSEELARATMEALGEHKVVLWEKHGCLAIGAGALEAFDLIDTVNKSAQIFLACKNAGLTPEGLTAAQLEELDKFFTQREKEE